MTYSDYYTIVYGARRQLRYSDYYANLERFQSQQSQQSERSDGSRTDSAAAAAAVRRDPHDVLGVLRGCSVDDLKAAYRRRVWELHPDRQAPHERPAAEQAFKEVSEAYRVLSGGGGGVRRGVPNGRWHFGDRNLPQRHPSDEYKSAFVEVLGVTRLKREQTLSHVIRSVLCDKEVPRQGRR